MDQGTQLEGLLNLALQRDLRGFEGALKQVMGGLQLSAWACFFPPSFEAGGRPLVIAHGINAQADLRPLQQNLRLLEADSARSADLLKETARSMNPEVTGQSRIVRLDRESGTPFLLFLYRNPEQSPFQPDELNSMAAVGRQLDRCFLVLAGQQEQEFLLSVFRMITNLQEEGVCILDSRRRFLFQNRKFREQMLLWSNRPEALRSRNLPKQISLSPEWRQASDKSFALYEETSFSARSHLSVSRGPIVSLERLVTDTEKLVGSVRYIAFRNSLGVFPYLFLTSRMVEVKINGHVSLQSIAKRFSLSERETEVAKLILNGCSGQDICTELGIAMPTTKTHIRHILRKSGVHRRPQFIALCISGQD